MAITSEMIKVGHARDCTHYCGRASSYKGIGENLSVLGNPYLLTTEDKRDLVCDLYEEDFDKLRETKPGFQEALDKIIEDVEIQKVTLGCFCKPKRCHCDTIHKYVVNYIKEKIKFKDW